MTENHDIAVSRLFIFDPAASRTIDDIYVGTATQPERQGQELVVIVELPRFRGDQSSVLDGIIGCAVKNFQQARTSLPETVLETVLESLNLFLPTAVPKYTDRWLEHISMLVAVSDNGQIHFSAIGAINSYIMQDSRLSLIAPGAREINPLKIFSSVTSGVLNPGDVMLFTTPPLIDYFADAKLRATLHSMSPSAAVRTLETQLSAVPAHVTFTSVIIKFTTDYDRVAPRPQRAPIAQTVPDDVVDLRSQTETEDRRPGGFSAPSRMSGQRTARYQRPTHYSRLPRSLSDTHWLLRLIQLAGRNLLFYLWLVGRVLDFLLRVLWRSCLSLIRPSRRQAVEAEMVTQTETWIKRWRLRWFNLQRLQRAIIVLLAVLIFAYVHILIFRSQELQFKRSANVFNETLLTVSQKKQEADSAILYKDEQQAEALYVEIGSLLHGLVPHNQDEEKEVARYLEENNRNLNTVRHINYITSPLVFSDLSQLAGPMLYLTIAGNDVYFASGTDIYRWQGNQSKKLSTAPEPIRALLAAGNQVYSVTNGHIYTVNGNDLSDRKLPAQTDNTSFDQSLIYAGNLYVFDAPHSSIFKYSNSFNQGSLWLKDETLLKGVNDFAVDGSIYLATDKAEILKLFRGAKQNFDYHRPNPPLGKASTIYTTGDSKYLYLTDPENQRVIILGKDGTIKDQYTSSKFDHLTDLTVNAAEDTIYLLNGNMIYLLAVNK